MTRNEVITIAVLTVAVIAITVVAVMHRRYAKRNGGRSPLSGALGAIDEVFHPSAGRAMEVREAEQEVPTPAPLPGEPNWDVVENNSNADKQS